MNEEEEELLLIGLRLHRSEAHRWQVREINVRVTAANMYAMLSHGTTMNAAVTFNISLTFI